MDDIEILHIYGQDMWHVPAYIAGNRAALIALADAISDALSNGVGSMAAFQNDGEGFNAIVVLADEEEADKLVPAYDIEYATGKDGDISPSKLAGEKFTKILDGE